MDKVEYVRKLTGEISEAFNGNPAFDQMGQLEELCTTQQLLVDGLSSIIAMLTDQKILNIEDIKKLLERGYSIKEVK